MYTFATHFQGLHLVELGSPTPVSSEAAKFVVEWEGKQLLSANLSTLRSQWEEASFSLDTSLLKDEEMKSRVNEKKF